MKSRQDVSALQFCTEWRSKRFLNASIKFHQDVSALRGELAVMNRLARAQDRKFEGSEGYAMARRLWAVEEGLRVARLTIASLEAEVGCVAQSLRACFPSSRNGSDNRSM